MVIDKTVCTPYDGSHGLPLLIVGETDLQIVVKVVSIGRGTVTMAAARFAQALEDGAERGLERERRRRAGWWWRHAGRVGAGLQRGGAAATPARQHGLERAAPQPFEHDPIILRCVASRSPAPLHLKSTYLTNGRLVFLILIFFLRLMHGGWAAEDLFEQRSVEATF